MILRSEFATRIFSTHDAFRVLSLNEGYSKGTVYRALHDLFKRGSVERLGRGIYRVPVHKDMETARGTTLFDSVSTEFVPGPLEDSKMLLKNKGIEFMVTGASLFYRHIHHLPKRLIHLIYVTEGAGELAVTSLREAGFGALLNPTGKETSLALEVFPERDIFIIREFSELLGNIDGNACLERALVDLYFETSRGKTPFPEEEVGRIFLNVFRNEPVSLSRLSMFAGRRGLRKEMRQMVEYINSETPIEYKTENKHVRRFIEVLDRVEWR